MNRVQYFWLGAVALVATLASGCETSPPKQKVYSVLGGGTASSLSTGPASDRAGEAVGAERGGAPTDTRGSADFYSPGSGVFTGPTRAAAAPATSGAGGDVTLNFENTSIREVVQLILGELLGENYVVDPLVKGTITLHTSRPLSRDALLPTLEMILRMNAAALVRADGLYRVVPIDSAIQDGHLVPQLGDSSVPIPNGYSVRVVRLRYISVDEMTKIIEPFATGANLVRVDNLRNLLILAGTRDELRQLVETVEIFDVDWLAGMSVGLFTPDFVDAETLAADLQAVFGEGAESPLAGLIRFVTIERLDALLVITSRPEYLERARGWIKRLDRDTGVVGQRLFVYRVKNVKAVELAEVLNQVFDTQSGGSRVPSAELAPGLEPVALRGGAERPEAAAGGDARTGAAGRATTGNRAQASAAAGAAPLVVSGGFAVPADEDIRIIADEVNNALLVLSTAQQYRHVEAALEELDVVPLQVLIEATIAEVRLTGELTLGLEWYFENSLVNGYTGEGLLDLGAAGLNAIVPGFSYTIMDPTGGIRAVLRALAEDSKLNIVSSPNLMVLNNQQADINVGDQVPVTTQQQQATIGDSNIVNAVEYRDTGVLLTVTPRVNPGGLVIMDVVQEVSSVAPTSADNESLTPTIRQRKISSTVAVQSGETVVLGGLIREDTAHVETGFPWLKDLPVLGHLFSIKRDEASRTELVVLITPRVVQGADDSRAITQEFRKKMESLRPLAPYQDLPEPAPAPESAAEPSATADPPAPVPAPAASAGNEGLALRLGGFPVRGAVAGAPDIGTP